MKKFIIQEKSLKRKDDLINRKDKTDFSFTIILVAIFIAAYLFFQYGYFAK